MDEDELRDVLLARATRGAPRGADAIVEAVELSLPRPRPVRRRQRVVFALAMLTAAVIASVVVRAARDDGGVDIGHRVTPASRPHDVPTVAPTGVATSTATAAPTASPETIGSVHPINADTAWVVTSRRVLVTDDRGAH